MKKFAFTLMVAAMFAAPAFAQEDDRKSAEWDSKVRTELNLTADQATKYDALSTEYKGKMDALKQDASLSEAAQKDRKMQLKNEKETRLAEFLTPDQLSRYRDLMSDKKKKMKKDS